MASGRPLRVVLDARLISGVAGGVEQFVLGLAHGLGALGGPEEYLFLAHEGHTAWLEPMLAERMSLLLLPPVLSPHPLKRTLKAALPLATSVRASMRRPRFRGLDPSDGTIESAGADVMHFTWPGGFATSVPTIYHPWDLQHLHLPEFFTPYDRAQRDARYRTLCAQASVVAVASRWGKDDLARHYDVPLEKIAVVPIAAATAAYQPPHPADVENTRRELGLPEAFAFYPAQTWPHKNHLRLLDALALLRDRDGLRVDLVCSGHRNRFYATIDRRIRELRLSDQVRFVDFVSSGQLQALYELARCLVFPTKFEGWGMPLTEAFRAGLPATCSNVTCLPEQAGDAALLFDPDSPEQIAAALRRLWTDSRLREELGDRGRRRAAAFSWESTARVFRANYRALARLGMTDEDARLVELSRVTHV